MARGLLVRRGGFCCDTEAARLRFRVGELARQAVLDRNRPQNELYVLMTIEQFDRTSNDGVRSTEETKLVEAMAKDVLDMIKGRSTPSPLSIKYAASSRFTIHVKMLEKLMARDEKDVAIELLRAMQQSNMVYGTARGIVPYDGTRHGRLLMKIRPGRSPCCSDWSIRTSSHKTC